MWVRVGVDMDLWVLIISRGLDQCECWTIDQLWMWVRVGIGVGQSGCGYGSVGFDHQWGCESE